MNWLLDATAFDTYHDELVDSIERYGDKVVSLKHPDPPYHWSDIEGRIRSTFPKGTMVITHGDIDLVGKVIDYGDWVPGAFATVENFRCSSYFPHLGKHLLNRDNFVLPFAELGQQAEYLFRELGRNGKLFVRPDSPLKLFTGMEIGQDTWSRDLDYMSIYEFPLDTLVVVSSPKDIESEWRFVVANQKIVDGSMYKHHGDMCVKPGYDAQALEFARAIAALGYEPDPVWVLDIAKTGAGEYAVVEIGGFSFANLYACSKDLVVEAVSKVISVKNSG